MTDYNSADVEILRLRHERAAFLVQVADLTHLVKHAHGALVEAGAALTAAVCTASTVLHAAGASSQETAQLGRALEAVQAQHDKAAGMLRELSCGCGEHEQVRIEPTPAQIERGRVEGKPMRKFALVIGGKRAAYEGRLPDDGPGAA